MAELHHVFFINVLLKIAFGLVLRDEEEISAFRLSIKHAVRRCSVTRRRACSLPRRSRSPGPGTSRPARRSPDSTPTADARRSYARHAPLPASRETTSPSHAGPWRYRSGEEEQLQSECSATRMRSNSFFMVFKEVSRLHLFDQKYKYNNIVKYYCNLK